MTKLGAEFKPDQTRINRKAANTGMGRHSMPDPEDSIDQPSNQFAASGPDQSDEIDHGYQSRMGYPEPVFEPAATGSPSYRSYPHGAEHPADSTPEALDETIDYQSYWAEDRNEDLFVDGAADDHPDFPPRPAGSSTSSQDRKSVV